MTEFTRVNIDSKLYDVRKALSSPERLHAIIEKAVSAGVAATAAKNEGADASADATTQKPRTLWRFDAGVRGQNSKLYILSSATPSVEVFADQLDVDPEKDFASCPYEPFLSRLQRGQEWGFRLRVNPTRSVRTDDSTKRGKRVGIIKKSEQIEWLLGKAAHSGFHMPINRLESPEVVIRESAFVNFERQGATVTFSSAVFDGVLAIDDPDMLRRVMTEGIGRAKGYGFGLLTLVPLQKQSYEGDNRE